MYTSTTIDKDLENKNGKMVTVTVHVNSFFDRKALTRDTGRLSSTLAQAVFGQPAVPVINFLVQYMGETTDRYGNKSEDGILNYFFDQQLYSKINWNNFDQANLCSFLQDEGKASGSESAALYNNCIFWHR